jgi:hypothetical protein
MPRDLLSGSTLHRLSKFLFVLTNLQTFGYIYYSQAIFNTTRYCSLLQLFPASYVGFTSIPMSPSAPPSFLF